MTELEWLVSDNPLAMLTYLSGVNDPPVDMQQRPHIKFVTPRLFVSDRKMRLFICACARQVAHLLDKSILVVVDEFEKLIDSGKNIEALRAAWSGTRHLTGDNRRWVSMLGTADAQYCAGVVAGFSITMGELVPDDERMSHLFRDVSGNIFNPVKLPRDGNTPLPWRTPLVLSIANAAYEERRAKGHLDPASVLALSDALEEAGCGEEGIIQHLRDSGPHVRGCWAIDLILGKE